MIIATAGHVDHGKTTLLQAITGVNTSRLPEEKRRGMTIDLGYAYLPLDDQHSLGFVDVPGHEKFLANMLAGIGGIKHALLVVACDDGVMPQTREHLAILRLIGTPSLTVALTKADRVDEQRIAAVKEEVRQELQRQGWPAVEIFTTSAETGAGIAELRDYLSQLAEQQANEQARFRLAIDRAFTIKGSGLIVTGTAFSGQVHVGDTLWLTGRDIPVRVRALHAQNQPTEHAGAGDRIAINIVGDVSKQEIERGSWLLTQEPPQAASRVLATMVSDKPIRHWQPVHLHHAASHITGRISLLDEAHYHVGQPVPVELVLDKPLHLTEDDRLIIRDIGAKETLGGARVLELSPPRRGKRQPEYLQKLEALRQAASLQDHLKLRLADGTFSIARFSWARQMKNDAIVALLQQLDCLLVGDVVLQRDHIDAYKEKLLSILADYHEQHGDQLGVGRARLKRMALPTEPDTLIFALIDQLLNDKQVINTRGWLHLPEHGLDFSPEHKACWTVIEPLFTEEALWVRDISQATKFDEALVRKVLKKAAQLGLVTAIVKDRYYLSFRIQQFADIIRAQCEVDGFIDAATFRDKLNVGRKLAVQILEFFDKTGFTRRRGNDHLLRDSALFSTPEA